MELKIGKYTNSELIQEIVKDINGLKYYPDFLTDKQHQQLLDVLDSLDYQIVNGRPTKYFGLNYTHKKKTHDSEKNEIPHFFNLMEPIGLEFDQLVIEYFRSDDGHSFLTESELFDSNILIIPIGSSIKYSFTNGKKNIDFLVEPKSLLHIGGESRWWKRCIRPRQKEKFNHYIIKRNEFYILTFRNIKH